MLLALPLVGIGVAAPSQADTAGSYRLLCRGYDSCAAKGFGNAGYKGAQRKMYWNMYSGTNCVNYAAYRLIQNGYSSQRPWSGSGNATNWGVAMRSITTTTPVVGSIAWWKGGAAGAGRLGHVAYVEKIVSSNEIWISESNWGSEFSWRAITRSGGIWPTGFIHFRDTALTNVSPPTVVGTPELGQTITADPGTWKPAADYAYQWLADGSPIVGQKGRTFTIGVDQVGKRMSFKMTARKSGYAAVSLWSAKAPVTAPGNQGLVADPRITGTPQVGQPLTATTGTFTPQPGPTTTRVQWLADGEPIAGATTAKLVPTPQLVGKVLNIRVTAQRKGYRDRVAESPELGPVVQPDIRLVQPGAVTGLVDGRARYGTPLTVQTGVPEPADARATVTWLRDGVAIPGAVRTTYRPVGADVGKQISARVVHTRSGYRDKTQTYAVASTVATPAQFYYHVNGRIRTVAAYVKVSGPGRPRPGGSVTVVVGASDSTQRQTARVNADGYVRLVFRNVTPGNRRVTISYTGDGVVDAMTKVVAATVKR